MTDPKTDFIDDLLASARRQDVIPDASLMARVMADAHRISSELPPQMAQTPGVWAQLGAVLGGWPSLGGLAVATVAGVWVGITPPAALDDFSTALIGPEITVELFAVDITTLTGGL